MRAQVNTFMILHSMHVCYTNPYVHIHATVQAIVQCAHIDSSQTHRPYLASPPPNLLPLLPPSLSFLPLSLLSLHFCLHSFLPHLHLSLFTLFPPHLLPSVSLSLPPLCSPPLPPTSQDGGGARRRGGEGV